MQDRRSPSLGDANFISQKVLVDPFAANLAPIVFVETRPTSRPSHPRNRYWEDLDLSPILVFVNFAPPTFPPNRSRESNEAIFEISSLPLRYFSAFRFSLNFPDRI